METAIQSFLTSPTSLEGVGAWIASPDPRVGSNNAPLTSAPSGIDSASRALCKSQSYTSWDCYSRSYVGSVSVRVPQGNRRRRDVVDDAPQWDPLEPDEPTQDELEQLSRQMQRMYQQGTHDFFRGVGLLSRKQQAHPEYQALLRRRCVRERCEEQPSNAHGGTRETRHRGRNAQHSTTPVAHNTRRRVKRAAGDKDKPPPMEEVDLLDSSDDPTAEQMEEMRIERERLDLAEREAYLRQQKLNKQQQGGENTGQQKSGGAGAEILGSAGLPQNRASNEQNTPPADPPVPPGGAGGGGNVPPPAQPPPGQVPNPAPNPPAGAGNVAGDAPRPSTFYSDTLPVRVFNVTTYKTQREIGLSIPYSATYVAFTQRMTDPASTGALGAVVRGPTIRDATSLAALCKYLQKDTGTYYEMASVVRIACIAASITMQNYVSEVIQYRFLRDFTPTPNTYRRPMIAPPVDNTQHIRAVAMPLDVYLAFIACKLGPVTMVGPPDNQQEGPFKPGRMDEYWTAVPLRSEIALHSWVYMYTVSFLHSLFWNGRVNWAVDGRCTNNDNTPGVARDVHMSFMPTTSSVYVPGPRNVIFVLVDSTSQYGSTYLELYGGVRVPVFYGQPLVGTAEQPDPSIDLMGRWNIWFSNNNLANIPADCCAALGEVTRNLSVENNTELALSMVAEVYTALYQGMGVATNDFPPSYDWGDDAHGAWKLTAHEVLCRGSRLMCGHYTYQTPAEAQGARRRMVGYNFSCVSAIHRPPSGVTLTRAVNMPGDRFPTRVWRGWYPDNQTPTYNISSMDSIYRVAVYVGLVLTHEQQLLFVNGSALSGWVHMLGGALASQTAMAMAQNNISLPVWIGYDTRFDDVFSSDVIETLIKTAFVDIIRYINIQNLVDSWVNWDEDMISEYYGLNPFNNDNWFSYSPVPYHLFEQWAQKMDHSWGTMVTEVSTFFDNGVNLQGLLLSPTTGEFRAKSVCTIDADRYHPIVVFQQQGQLFTNLISWVDNYSYWSNAAAGNQLVSTKSYLESETFVLPPLNNGLSFTPTLPMYVINSAYSGARADYRPTRVSNIAYPDPVSLKSILEGAKNYLLYPALSALAGYATGGPAGAVVGGVSSVAKQLANDLTKGETTKRAHHAIDAASSAVTKALEQTNPLHPVHNEKTHMNLNVVPTAATPEEVPVVKTPDGSLEP